MADKSKTGSEKRDPRQVAIAALVAQMNEVFAGKSAVVGVNATVTATVIVDGEPSTVVLFEGSGTPKLKDNNKVGCYIQGKGVDASGVTPLGVQFGLHATWIKSDEYPR